MITKINEFKLILEGKWSDIMKHVNNSTGPWTLVVIDNITNKVIDQSIVKIKDAIPAHYEHFKREYLNKKIHIEDNGGLVIWIDK